jgi:glucose/arabinose dehydrogenase
MKFRTILMANLGSLMLMTGSGVHAQDIDWRAVDPVLPEGFQATVFHPGLGAARHVAVRDNGDVFTVRPFRQAFKMIGQEASYGSLIAMRDTDGDGDADIVREFGPSTVTTEVRIHGGYLYFGTNLEVFRVELDDNLVPAGVAEPIAGGFPLQQSHADKTFAIDPEGFLYVNSGVPSIRVHSLSGRAASGSSLATNAFRISCVTANVI